MVFTDHVEPATEVVYFMARQLAVEMLVDIHDRILCSFRLSEVLEANTIDQLHIAEKQGTQCLTVTSGAEAFDQYFIRYFLILQSCVGWRLLYSFSLALVSRMVSSISCQKLLNSGLVFSASDFAFIGIASMVL